MRAPTLAGCLLVAVFAVAAALPASALAHEGNPNFRSEITGLDPPAPGVEVEVLNFDDSLLLRNDSGATVVVEGYQSEPYVRISPDGTVEVNERSPSFYLNQDRFAEASVPDSADPDAPPDWQLVDESGQYTWHDHRSHYMGSGTPPQVSDESLRTKVFDYAIPLRVGSTDTKLNGTLYWVGDDDGFPLAPFIALAAVALLTLATVVLVRRRRRSPGPDRNDGEAKEAW